jgi:Pectate lyase
MLHLHLPAGPARAPGLLRGVQPARSPDLGERADGHIGDDGGADDGPASDAARADAAPGDAAPGDKGLPKPPLAFPSAVGWGKQATGGRGGAVRKVTNLKDSGAGSLRAAWEKPGKATIIFEVAGTITVSSAIAATGDKTVAGETAFRGGGQGITLKRSGSYGNSVVSGEMNNTIVRFMRFRPGPGKAPECCGDAMTITKGQKVIFDHCSMSWSTDETFNTWGPVKYVTVQNTIFAEPLMFSTHTYSTDPTHASYKSDHSKAFLAGGDDSDPAKSSSHLSLFNTIFVHSKDRNPALAGAGVEYEVVNTLLYNWISFGTKIGGQGKKAVNVINHYAINGKETSTARYPLAARSNARLFVKGIYNTKRTTSDWSGVGCETGCGAGYMTQPAPKAWQVTTPFNYPLKSYPLLTASQIKTKVMAAAGANLQLDAVDKRIFDEINKGTGGKIDHPSEVGGWPVLAKMSSVPKDSDGDGMPDLHEDAKGLDKQAPADGAADSGDGYTHLEKYLFTLTKE